MSSVTPQKFLFDTQNSNEMSDKSPSLRSRLSFFTYRNRQNSQSSSLHRVPRLTAGPSIDSSIDLSDAENDSDDNTSARENYRFAPQIIRARYSRHNSLTAQQRYFRPSTRKTDPIVIQAPPPGSNTISPQHNSLQNSPYKSSIDNQAVLIATNTLKDNRGQTLLHLAARLAHDEIMRLLISETSQVSMLRNKKGQTPLLTAIEAGSTSTATLLMESDPRSIIASDNNGSSVFHYACEHCNDIVLQRAIGLSKRLNSTSDRITVKMNFYYEINKWFALGITSYHRKKLCW
jgi:hypothetical protein